MQSILDAINEWIKEILIGAINGNLSTMFGEDVYKRQGQHNRNHYHRRKACACAVFEQKEKRKS